ncbi:squalene synthase [Mycena polygramma]|nr:squalene synthase [Mycena polygramma]
MGLSTWLLMLVTHPLEFRTLLQYYIYSKQKRDITAPQEHATSGWDRATMQRCWYLLDLTSRSYAFVIKELEGDMARVVCMFYLVLRALDTIEDDMTLSSSVKQPLLRNFPAICSTPGWTFTESGPDEKDRQLLVEYTVVTAELGTLQPAYRAAIMRTAEKMGAGMADFVAREEREKATPWLETIAEYDLYCHYVAGLVGEGLSLLFAASGKEFPHLAAQLELSNSMALLLQKTNITRDFREDVDARRYFWPREIWAGARYGGAFARPEEMCNPAATQRALWVQSAMVLDALRYATDALDYLRLLTNQNIFTFVAIPATMAIATLELCFMNPDMFARNVKIRKAVAASLIMRSTNLREVSSIFREYARKIHARAVPADPNFIRLSVACGKIEQWCEHHYPSFVRINAPAGGGRGRFQSIDCTDARGRTFLAYEKARTERTPAPRWVPMYLGAIALVLLSVISGVVYMKMQMSD